MTRFNAQTADLIGGRCRGRTCDTCRVKAVDGHEIGRKRGGFAGWTCVAGLISALFCTGIAQAQDHVYIYGNKVNRSLNCENYLFYVDTSGNGRIWTERCMLLKEDTGTWPVFPSLSIRVHVEEYNRKPHFNANCLFVAHAQNADGTTSTVVDCR